MRIAALAPALALAALLALPSRSPASPQFTKMNVAISTGDRGKSAETRLEISVVPDAGGPAVAYLDVQGVEFAPYATVRVVVPAVGGGFSRGQLPHMHIELSVSGERIGVWHASFDAVLNFDDGSQALLGSGSLSLSGARPMAGVPLSLATVAGTGLLGHMERFGFGLMSKDTAASEPSSSSPHRSTKEFTHMDITLSTGERGAEPGTRVEISIAPRAGGPDVAYLDVRDRVFAPYTKVSEVVLPAGGGFVSGDLKKEQIVVKVTPPGGGTWTCAFDAIIHFADGSQALLGSGDLALSSVRDVEAVPLSAATTAHVSLLGSVEKFGFKLLSKSSVKQTPEPAPSPSAAETGAPGAEGQQAAARPPRPMAPDQFTGMDIKLYSTNRGKEADVPLEISIVPKAGGPAVAHLDVQDQAIRPGASVRVEVPPAGDGFTAADLKGEQIVVKIAPPGHCTWTHGMDIVVHFADGSAALWSVADLALSDYRNEEFVSLSDATMARGFFGGVKKFGFGVLNTLGK